MRRVGCYVAISESNDVYVGQSFDLDRRAREHERGKGHVGHLDTIAQYEVEGCNPYASLETEGRLIRFYQVQSEDGEDFEMLNTRKLKRPVELEWRYPENYGTLQ